jgi:hypothetical protein
MDVAGWMRPWALSGRNNCRVLNVSADTLNPTVASGVHSRMHRACNNCCELNNICIYIQLALSVLNVYAGQHSVDKDCSHVGCIFGYIQLATAVCHSRCELNAPDTAIVACWMYPRIHFSRNSCCVLDVVVDTFSSQQLLRGACINGYIQLASSVLS